MQPAMTAADWFAQLMSPSPHGAPPATPFVPPFSPTQRHHQATGHSVPQPMQTSFANSTFAQPPTFHTINTPHYNTALPGLQPLPQHNPASQGLQASPPQCVTSFTYQPTTHPTSTAPAQPLPTTSASQQYSPTNALTLPRSHAKHSRTRSRTTRKHRSTSRHRRRRRSTKQHHTCHTSRHRSTTPRHRRHTSQHRSRRRRQHHSPILRSRSNFRPRTRHRTTSRSQHTPPRHCNSPPQQPPRPRTLPPLPPQHHRSRDRHWCIHSTLASITSIWILEPDPDLITLTQHLHGHEHDDVELPPLSMHVQMRGF